jgi:hypothetical protein
MMPVPDETIFGDNPEIGGITYREVRKIESDQQKLEILKSRIDSFLKKQVDNLSLLDKNEQPVIWSQFIIM